MGLPPVQRKAAVHDEAVQRREGGAQSASDVQGVAAAGVSGAGTTLPHFDLIQRAFGRHDVSGIQAHVGGPAAAASDAIGANAYATGSHMAFRESPDLHTAAHEAAHVVQQRGGVQLKGSVGEAGDRYEQHADAVADRVVRGESAEGLLDEMAGGSTASPSTGPVQRDIKDKGPVPMGEFAIDMKKEEHSGGTSGMSGTVKFTPNDKSPDAKSIRLTQAVKDLDMDSTPNKDYVWTGDEADRNKMMTSDSSETYVTKTGDTLQSISHAKTGGHITPDEIYQANKSVLKSAGATDAIPEKTSLQIPKVEGGFFVDHSAADPKAAPRANSKDAQVSPYYRDYWPNASESQDGSKQGKKIEPASLWDFPGSGGNRRFSFETVAHAREIGLDYGTIHWAFTIQSSKITNESHRVVEGTSETFQAAQTEFNEFYKNPHVVMAGETLQTISQKYFGTPDKSKDIYNANKPVIPDPDHLQPGTKLTIPGVSA
jgi:nucleoid-associated protein YgaU